MIIGWSHKNNIDLVNKTIPKSYFTYITEKLSFLSYLFSVYYTSNREVWCFNGGLDGNKKNNEMPPFSPRWL